MLKKRLPDLRLQIHLASPRLDNIVHVREGGSSPHGCHIQNCDCVQGEMYGRKTRVPHHEGGHVAVLQQHLLG